MTLSIITITYNNQNGLTKTLNSIRQQTFSDYEQIIIDGGSADNSIMIMRNFADTAISPFIMVSEKDNGVYDAQNKGILLANGEYCLFLNAGDYFVDSTVLERVFNNKPDVDIIYGNLLVVNESGKKIGICKGKEHITFLDIYSGIIKHQASFIKRNLFDQYGLYDNNLKIIADWAFFLYVIGFKNASVKYIPVDITCFENNGISNNNPEQCVKERQIVLDKYMPGIMQEDYRLLDKFNKIRKIDGNKIATFLFRLLTKVI